MQRLFAPRRLGQRAMKLELQNVGEKVAHVRNVGGHVILGAGVEILLASVYGRSHALVFQLQFPPCLVVLLRWYLAGEHLPAPLVNEQAKGQEGDFLQRFVEQEADVFGGVRRLVEQADLDQVFRRYGKRNGVAHRLVEAVVGAVAEEEGLGVISALVKVVAKLVVDGREVFARDVNAHLDAQIVDEINVPGAGVADHIAVLGLHEKRTLPETFRQGRKTQGSEEAFAIADHLLGVRVPAFQDLR